LRIACIHAALAIENFSSGKISLPVSVKQGTGLDVLQKKTGRASPKGTAGRTTSNETDLA